MEPDFERDPVTGDFKFNPRAIGLNLTWDEFQAELIAEFDAYNEDLLRIPTADCPPEAEFAKLIVLEMLLSPASAIQFCDRFRDRLQCPLADHILLKVLWQKRDAVDAVQNSQN
jgi:hypothetical protein